VRDARVAGRGEHGAQQPDTDEAGRQVPVVGLDVGHEALGGPRAATVGDQVHVRARR
jgi:hypothetical protein